MRYIAHRGNIDGPNPKMENHPIYIDEAHKRGYWAEVDVWYDKGWWLGHDKPQYRVPNRNLLYCNHTICHAKNAEALRRLNETDMYHCFWHQKDDYTVTSWGFVWVYPGIPLIKNSICVLPEQKVSGDIRKCFGICSDYVAEYKEQYK